MPGDVRRTMWPWVRIGAAGESIRHAGPRDAAPDRPEGSRRFSAGLEPVRPPREASGWIFVSPPPARNEHRQPVERRQEDRRGRCVLSKRPHRQAQSLAQELQGDSWGEIHRSN